MRLIDADAIEYEQIMDPMGNGMYSHANHVYEGVIDAMPTVDAIPVKWLEERYPIHDTYGTEAYFRKAYAIYEVIKEWKERKTDA